MMSFSTQHFNACFAFVLVLCCCMSLGSDAHHTGEGKSLVGKFDGSIQVTSAMYREGYGKDGDANFVVDCAHFDDLGDSFVLEVKMGEYSDYFIAAFDTSLCDLLTSSSKDGKYRYSPTDPLAEDWDGYSEPVGLPSPRWPKALGGSPFGFLKGGQMRQAISFWGSDNENTKGGCCYSAPHQSPSWYQPFELYVTPFDAATLFMVWVAKPAVVVQNEPVVFMLKVWNSRGVVFNKELTFEVNLNGEKHTVTSRNRATLLFDEIPKTTPDTSESFELTVTLNLDQLCDNCKVQNEGVLELTLPVVEQQPSSAKLTPCRVDGGVTSMLHFGEESFAIGPIENVAAMEDDWFAHGSSDASSGVGEALIRPVENHKSVALGDTLLGKTEKSWTLVKGSEEGEFASPNPHSKGSLRFYAFTLHSAAPQEAVLQVKHRDDIIVYIGHEEVLFPNGSSRILEDEDNLRITTFSIHVGAGYHQVLIKLHTTGSSSYLSFHPFGTGLSFTTETPIMIPDGAYEMWTDAYMFSLMNSGATVNDVLEADTIDEDLIGVHTATPRAQALVQPEGTANSSRWAMNVFSGGNIPIDGYNISEGKNFVVRYVALALYNQYDVPHDIQWKLIVKGKTDFYIDGDVQYSADEDASETVNITTTLTPGWHQMIVRIATAANTRWMFRYYLYFNSFRLIGAPEIGHSMPPGVRLLHSGIPIESMLELTSVDDVAPIPYDATSEKETAMEFVNEGLQLGSSQGDSGIAHFSYEARNITIGDRKDVPYVWLPVQHTSWGGQDNMGGSTHRFWAFSIYAATDVELTATINYRGALAVWVDGKVTTVTKPTQGDSLDIADVPLQLKKGWHQVSLKLQAANAFTLEEDLASEEEQPWLSIAGRCRTAHGVSSNVCPREAYCPLGSPRRGVGLPIDADTSVMAPVLEGENQWVELAAGGSSTTKLCGNYSTLTSTISSKSRVACCSALPPVSLSISFVVPEQFAEKVGYAYQPYLELATPTFSMDQAYLPRRTVTIATTTTDDAAIRYKVVSDGDDEDAVEWITYTGPFVVTQTSQVLAQTTRSGTASELYVSKTGKVTVKVQTSIVVARSACMRAQPCPLVFSGAMPSWRASLVSTALTPKEAQKYADIAFATTEAASSVFSGVATIDTKATAVLSQSYPTTEDQVFSVFVYDEVNGTLEATVHMAGTTNVAPSRVVRGADVMFSVTGNESSSQGGVVAGDAVIFPHVAMNLPTDGACEHFTCQTAFQQYPQHMRALSAALTFQADLSAYDGERLTCMCVCLSCYDRDALTSSTSPPTAAQLVVIPDRIAAVPIDIDVISGDPVGPTSEAPSTPPPSTPAPAVRPSGPSASLIIFGILLPVLAVVLFCGLGVWCIFAARKRRRSQVYDLDMDVPPTSNNGESYAVELSTTTVEDSPDKQKSY